MSQLIIPDFQPVPFPAPLPLLQILLVLGFFLHVLPMSAAFGGSLLSGVMLLNSKPNSYPARAGNAIATGLPVLLSFAITQGIVPLLFLQLVYGPLYYTSSIVMGTFWIFLLAILLVGYYLCYVYKFKHAAWGPKTAWLLLLAWALFACVGFLFSNNMTLMLKPETWQAVIFSGNSVGNYLNLSEPTLIPRYLFFVTEAIAITGLFIGCLGLYWQSREQDYGSWLLKKGATIYLIFNIVQLVLGSMWFNAMPQNIQANLMGGDSIGTLAFGVFGATEVLALLGALLCVGKPMKRFFNLGMISALVSVLSMTVVRHMIREYSVNPFFHPEKVPVNTQWDLLIVFILSAVGLLVYLAWLIKTTWTAFHPKQEAL